MFAAFFAAYAVLKDGVNSGPSGKDLFNLPYALIETFVLLFAALTSGIGSIFVHRRKRKRAITFFLITALLGLGFLSMEWIELSDWIQRGYSWKFSAFLSTFFTIIGTHAFHVFFAILWVFVFLIPLFFRQITDTDIRRLSCLRMFWQFIFIVWVCIFNIVYLIGAL